MPSVRSDNVIAFPSAAGEEHRFCPEKTLAAWLAHIQALPIGRLFRDIQLQQRDLLQPRELAFLVNHPRFTQARRVLEIGPGEEQGIGSVAGFFPDQDFFTVDLTLSARTSPLGKRTIHVNIADLGTGKWPLPEDSFDAIVLRFATQCVPSFDSFYQRLAGTLAPGGSVYVIEPVDSLRRFSHPLPTLDLMFEKLEFFQKAFGGQRNASLSLENRLAVSDLHIACSDKAQVGFFTPHAKQGLAILMTMICEYVCRMTRVKISVEELMRELLSWHFAPGGWGQMVMHYLELRKDSR